MIQELLAGVVEDQRNKMNNHHHHHHLPPSSSASTQSSPSQSNNSSDSAQQPNLRCPRCDSSNTKFCYYNNYNLTQPRHFCKTCRRYWTKGGALRNVPIGGGCRKTKAAAPTITVTTKSGGGGKTKPMTSLDAVMGRVAGLGGVLDHSSININGSSELLPSSPILWASMPHSSHLLALLRASQLQNANPNHSPSSYLLNSMRIKEEGAGMVGGAAQMVHPEATNCLGMDHLSQLPIWRNENQLFQQQQPQNNNLLLNEVPTSSGIQELYQRLQRSSGGVSSYCNSDHLQNNGFSSSAAMTTMATTTTASIMEPVPLSGGEFGYWNPTMAWTDLSATANGAAIFP